MSTFVVATFNTLHGTADIHPLASVIGWQEADTVAGRKKIRDLDGYATYVPKADALSAIPISWRIDTWELLAAGEHMTHAGKAGITPNRGYSWVILRHRATGVVVCFVNTHFISGAWSWRMTPWRRDRWNEHMRELAAFVTKRGQTMPVVLVGDMNRPEWLRLPGFHHAAIRSGRVPIDQIHSTLPLSPVRRGPKHGSDHYSWTATVTVPSKETKAVSTYRTEHRPSPNHSSRARYGWLGKPNGIVIHHWGVDGQSHEGVVKYLCRPRGNTSAHEVISAGLVSLLVDHLRAAWHSGSTIGNGRKIGLECRPEMSDDDWDTLVQRCTDIEEKWGSMTYGPHSQFKATACPGRYRPRIPELVKAVNAEHARRGADPEPKPLPAPKKKPLRKSRTILRAGSNGPAVEAMQRGLNRVFPTYSRLTVDGDFGRKTEVVVREFQRRAGLTVDGVVGSKTRAALNKHGVRF